MIPLKMHLNQLYHLIIHTGKSHIQPVITIVTMLNTVTHTISRSHINTPQIRMKCQNNKKMTLNATM
jgi:hypothetical protein